MKNHDTAPANPLSAGTCCECGHTAGCDCDCCPYPLPAATAENPTGGAR
jgi:hypothetical protein